jgi:uncharacterized protein YbjQ (UPF0145 family)
MDRSSLRYGALAIKLCLAVGMLAATGCQGALLTALWLAKGNNTPAEYDGLREKSVVVVCRPVAGLEYRDTSVARDIARQLSRLLQENVSKIKVIDQRKVAQWDDENTWEEFTEVGEALGADMVVGIDLQDFTVYQGQTLYQGKASITVHVYDCINGNQLVYERELPQAVYPPNTGVPTSEKLEAEFRREFVMVLADQIGRHFYPHDVYTDYALDATAFN